MGKGGGIGKGRVGREGIVCKRNLLIEQGSKEGRKGRGGKGKGEGEGRWKGRSDNMLGKQYSLSTSPRSFLWKRNKQSQQQRYEAQVDKEEEKGEKGRGREVERERERKERRGKEGIEKRKEG